MNYDKHYLPLFDLTKDHELLVKSGWIDEKGWAGSFSLDEVTFPLPATETEQPQAVLLYPGCFAPIHEGHLKCMEIAKETVEAQTGEKVIAGIFAPDNDDYVQRKVNDMTLNADRRLRIAEEAVQDNPWMVIDTWCANYAAQALNFTTLYDRTVEYLNHHLPNQNIKVYLVFGGDNTLFANAFIFEGYAVCVQRTGATPDTSLLLPDPDNRVLYSNTAPPVMSSTAVRAQLANAL